MAVDESQIEVVAASSRPNMAIFDGKLDVLMT